ncbi:glutaredoxin family protein [Brevibacillus sp. TJ4]|uniref:glutaredoxin family protein n=1 Tax=Brevibacillus sp. TJ4 TaxID=3234853 RepID=UPI0037D4915C
MIRIVLYGRPNCHLCEDVELAVRTLEHVYPLSVEVVNIEQDPLLHERFMLEIPVVEIDGEVVFRSVSQVVTIAELDRELAKRSAK